MTLNPLLILAISFSFPLFAVDNEMRVDDLAVGDQLEFPKDTKLEKVYFDRKFAAHKFSDPVEGSSCTVSLSNSEGPVTLNSQRSWQVTDRRRMPASDQDCRIEVKRKTKEDLEKTRQILQGNWISENQLTRSLYQQKASETYLKKVDELNSAPRACEKFFAPNEYSVLDGPTLLTLKNANVRDRKMFVMCDRKGVPLGVLTQDGIDVTLAPEWTRMPASQRRPPVRLIRRAGSRK